MKLKKARRELEPMSKEQIYQKAEVDAIEEKEFDKEQIDQKAEIDAVEEKRIR